MKRSPNARIAKTPSRDRVILGIAGVTLLLALFAWFSAAKLHSASSDEAIVAKPGPWGKLDFVRINIELPDHFIDVENIDANGWFFKGRTQDEAMESLRQCGLGEQQLQALQNATWELRETGCHVVPDDKVIVGLSADVRGKVYELLAASEENVDQYYAFTYQPERLPELMKYSGLRNETVDMFKSLLYPQGQLLRFADTDVVLRKLTDRRERLRFVKSVARRSTLLVKLNIRPETDIDTLVQYWSTGGRAKDLRPLLESLARVPGGCRIDIAHLLPPFARQKIYTYPNPDEDSLEARHDCHWTSLNFFNQSTLRHFANPEEAAQTIFGEYTEVGSDPSTAHFGDIIFLKKSDNTLIHSAVYIAADIVFTKNGAGLNQPWIYMKLDDMLAFYALPKESLQLAIYRPKQI